MAEARTCMDGKAKPPGSLGQLEDLAIKLAVLQDTLKPSLDEAFLFIFAADHGFTKSTPGASAYPRQVSAAVYNGIATGRAASAVLCKANNCKLILLDVGLDADVQGVDINTVTTENNDHITVVPHQKIKNGSQDFLQGPAMSYEDAKNAYNEGYSIVESTIKGSECGKRMAIGIGELGIGNTTSAAALVCALTGHPPELVCGRGTGLNDAGMALKISTVTEAILINKQLIQTGDPWKVLLAVGGLESAAMVGAYIAAAEHNVAIIVDGFISGSAALVACLMNSNVETCLFWSHKSAEQGSSFIMDAVREKNGGGGDKNNTNSLNSVVPILDMGLRLGEGTGAILALPIIRSAAAIMSNMAALQDIL